MLHVHVHVACACCMLHVHVHALCMCTLGLNSHLGVGEHRRILRVGLSQKRHRGLSRPVYSVVKAIVSTPLAAAFLSEAGGGQWDTQP